MNPSNKKMEETPLPGDNMEKQPEFQDENQNNFELANGSPFLEKKIGASGFASMKSDWPEQPEEQTAKQGVNKRLK